MILHSLRERWNSIKSGIKAGFSHITSLGTWANAAISMGTMTAIAYGVKAATGIGPTGAIGEAVHFLAPDRDKFDAAAMLGKFVFGTGFIGTAMAAGKAAYGCNEQPGCPPCATPQAAVAQNAAPALGQQFSPVAQLSPGPTPPPGFPVQQSGQSLRG